MITKSLLLAFRLAGLLFGGILRRFCEYKIIPFILVLLMHCINTKQQGGLCRLG